MRAASGKRYGSTLIAEPYAGLWIVLRCFAETELDAMSSVTRTST